MRKDRDREQIRAILLEIAGREITDRETDPLYDMVADLKRKLYNSESQRRIYRKEAVKFKRLYERTENRAEYLTDELEELRGKNDAERRKEMAEPLAWVSAKDRLPAIGRDVLVCTRSKNGSRNIDKGYYDGSRFVHRGAAEVTHWMPIPEMPEEEDENGQKKGMKNSK